MNLPTMLILNEPCKLSSMQIAVNYEAACLSPVRRNAAQGYMQGWQNLIIV